jgi:predicted nucleotidyltransferase
MLPQVDQRALTRLCQKYQVKRLALFGSMLAQNDRPDSDVDLLVEFADGSRPGWRMFELEHELSQLLGRPVDLNTAGFLSPTFRDSVVKTSRTLYPT